MVLKSWLRDQTTSPEPSRNTSSSLADLVGRFQVCWEASPEFAFVKHQRRQVGFTLELSGTHEKSVQHPTAGCRHCQEVYAALEEIAKHILPRDDRSSVYDLAPYDHALHYSPSRRGRPDVSLAIRIFNRGNLDHAVAECQERCLAEMKQRLRELGVREHQWASRGEVHS